MIISLFFSKIAHLYPKKIHLSLNRIKYLLKKLDHPEKKVPPIIHIAGTNGKGSTLAFLKSILNYHGYKVHRYTSPHLIHYNERIELCDTPVDKVTFYKALCDVYTINEEAPITPFEFLTATAFWLFAQKKADFLLLETGLGGRFDATNVIEHPLLTLISNIHFDHEDFLGTTLENIALEKAGIIKEKAPLLTVHQPSSVLKILQKETSLHRAPLIITEPMRGNLSLRGAHQSINAGLAVGACSFLKTHRPFEEKIIQRALHNTSWKGRLSRYSRGDQTLWVDGAHNESGAQTLSSFFTTPLDVIIGLKKRKNPISFLKALRPCVQHLFFIPLDDESEDFSPEELTVMGKTLTMDCLACMSLDEALKQCHKTVLITGSLSVIRLVEKLESLKNI